MTTPTPELSGLESTMLITLFLRAADCKDPRPVLGDRFAAEAIDKIAYDWKKLDKPYMTWARAAVALRSKCFDDWAREFIQRHPNTTVLQLACGLDSRAFRLDLPPSVRWFDVDLPDVIRLRRSVYKDAPGYRMIEASVTDPVWLEAIPRDLDVPVLVIAEGLLMYFQEDEVRKLVNRITDRFPTGEFLFDFIAPWIARVTQVAAKLVDRWQPYPGFWTAPRTGRDIERWNPRLRYRDHVAVVGQHAEIGDPTLRRLHALGARLKPIRNYVRVFRIDF